MIDQSQSFGQKYGLFILVVIIVVTTASGIYSNINTRNDIAAFKEDQTQQNITNCVYGVMRDSFILKFWQDQAKYQREISTNYQKSVLRRLENSLADNTEQYSNQVKIANAERVADCNAFKSLPQPAPSFK